MELNVDWWQAVILGVVEGLTEYLPISDVAQIRASRGGPICRALPVFPGNYAAFRS